MRFCFFGGYEEWKLWQRMSRGFEAENPDVRMKLLYWPGNYEDKVRLVMAAGTAPDVLSAQDEPFPNYCQLGQYEDLTPYMERFRANTRPISSFRPRWRRSATIGFLLFSDLRTNEIKKWTPDGTVTTFRKPSGNSNGLTLDRQGRLIACEQGKRRVSRTEKGGTVVTLADRYNGKRLNSPNDAVVRSDGSIFFTDPPYGIGEDPELQELPFSGVFRLSPDGKLTLLADDFEGPNGLAFSPDEKALYIDDTNRGISAPST